MLGNFLNMKKYTMQKTNTITQISVNSIKKRDKPNKINSTSKHDFAQQYEKQMAYLANVIEQQI